MHELYIFAKALFFIVNGPSFKLFTLELVDYSDTAFNLSLFSRYSDADPWEGGVEDNTVIASRVQNFLQWLLARPESRIAVVTHW